MSSKVILLKYLARIHDQSAVDAQRCFSGFACCDKTAIIVERDSNGFISIQGYSPVHQSEKHKAWSIFQQAIKQLLGIHRDTAICTRFADPPHETVGSISTLFHQSNHLIDLIVQPIHCRITANPTHIITNLSRPREAMAASVQVGGKDPYCAFRERYHNDSKSRYQPSLVRDRCNFAEMNRLISQLADVSICLNRTQHECELIEKRCSQKAAAENLSSTAAESSQVFRGSASDGAKAIKHSTSDSSSYSYDSGKGSMTDAEALKGVAGVEGEGKGEEGCDGISHQQTEDREVERLLQIAQSLTQQIHQQQLRKAAPSHSESPLLLHLPGTSPVPVPEASSPHGTRPDRPCEVVVRSSFRYGGAYVMWDPVSIDGSDMNCGQTVLGYHVYLDQQLQCKVGGALSSQVELSGMEDGCEYVVQVSTECERHSSLLTAPLVYRHKETNRPLPPIEIAKQPEEIEMPFTTQSNLSHQTTPTPVSDVVEEATSKPPQHVDQCQVAKVHTWLKNKDYSDLDQSQPLQLDNHTHQSKGHAPLHVHFADEELCVWGDDTKSISSSHTSGIVTDFPMSPKLIPHCSCQQCSTGFKEFSNSSPCHVSQKPTSISITTRTTDMPFSTEDIDTTIDEPPLFDDPGYLGSPARVRTTHTEHNDLSMACSVSENSTGHMHTENSVLKAHQRSTMMGEGHTLYKKQRKLPKAPTNVCVCGRKGETLAVTWDPVKRDGKGCSNGCYVLGYRIYVNGRCWLSVDGALTAKAALSSPIQSPSSILVQVRTRSMSAESSPSNTATLFKRKIAHKYEQVDLIHSSLETYV